MRLCRSIGVACLVAIGSLLLPGCGASKEIGPLHPVAGKVTLDGAKLHYGIVVFVPDLEKGNKLLLSPVARVTADGTYTIETESKQGAPAGWYKVMVITNDPGAPANAQTIAPRYGRVELTDLAVEVTPEPTPAAYDFGLSKK
ncbi:MAG: hypothetical protein K8U57_33810 [Planctomycetes bacterium]|nr:hypothetical protein [Planctomycetota bacterium]